MAELADALDSGSSESNFMEVQVLLPAPNSRNPNQQPIGEGVRISFFHFGGCEADLLLLAPRSSLSMDHHSVYITATVPFSIDNFTRQVYNIPKYIIR